MPAIRRWAIAWLETSITACVQPLATIRRIHSAISGALGVVSSAGECSKPSLVAQRAEHARARATRVRPFPGCWR